MATAMDVTLNTPVRPLSSDDLIYTITACDAGERFGFDDIVTIQWKNITTGEEGEDSYFLSQDDNVNEAPLNPLISMLTTAVGCKSTFEISCQRRFLNDTDSSEQTEELVLEFKSIDLRRGETSILKVEQHASRRQVLGNKRYGDGNYAGAVQSYSTALKILEEVPTRLDGIAFKCLNNLAACYMQQDQNDKALEVLRKVEKVDPNNVKMLWRTGRALLQLGSCVEALDYLTRACGFDPNSSVIKRDLKKAEAGIESDKAKEKELFSKMMASMQEAPESLPVETAEDGEAEEAVKPANNTQMSIDQELSVREERQEVSSMVVEHDQEEERSSPADCSFHFEETSKNTEEQHHSDTESTTTEALLADRLNDTRPFDEEQLQDEAAGEQVFEEDVLTPAPSVEVRSTTEQGDIQPSPCSKPEEDDDAEFVMITSREVANEQSVPEQKSSSFEADSAIEQSDNKSDGEARKEVKCPDFDEEGENACAVPPPRSFRGSNGNSEEATLMDEPTKLKTSPPTSRSRKPRHEPTPQNMVWIMGGIALGVLAVLVAYLN